MSRLYQTTSISFIPFQIIVDVHEPILSSACQNFGCYNGGTPETTDLNGEKTCVCKCMPGISGDHCEETKGTYNIPRLNQWFNKVLFLFEISDQLTNLWQIIFFIDAPCQCQDDRLDDNGGGNCEKPLAGASRNAGKDYCYVTLPSGCKDLEDSPVDGQEGQKISSEACNSGMNNYLQYNW